MTLFTCQWEECVLGIQTPPAKHIIEIGPSKIAKERGLQVTTLLILFPPTLAPGDTD